MQVNNLLDIQFSRNARCRRGETGAASSATETRGNGGATVNAADNGRGGANHIGDATTTTRHPCRPSFTGQLLNHLFDN